MSVLLLSLQWLAKQDHCTCVKEAAAEKKYLPSAQFLEILRDTVSSHCCPPSGCDVKYTSKTQLSRLQVESN